MEKDDSFRDVLNVAILMLVALTLILCLDSSDKIREDLANIGVTVPDVRGCEIVGTFLLPDTTKILINLTCPVKEIENEE